MNFLLLHFFFIYLQVSIGLLAHLYSGLLKTKNENSVYALINGNDFKLVKED